MTATTTATPRTAIRRRLLRTALLITAAVLVVAVVVALFTGKEPDLIVHTWSAPYSETEPWTDGDEAFLQASYATLPDGTIAMPVYTDNAAGEWEGSDARFIFWGWRECHTAQALQVTEETVQARMEESGLDRVELFPDVPAVSADYAIELISTSGDQAGPGLVESAAITDGGTVTADAYAGGSGTGCAYGGTTAVIPAALDWESGDVFKSQMAITMDGYADVLSPAYQVTMIDLGVTVDELDPFSPGVAQMMVDEFGATITLHESVNDEADYADDVAGSSITSSERRVPTRTIILGTLGILAAIATGGLLIGRPALKTADEEIEQRAVADRRTQTLGTLAHGMAHELRSPLRAMSGAANRLARGVEKTEKNQLLIDMMNRGEADTNQTLDSMLAMADSSKAEVARMDIKVAIRALGAINDNPEIVTLEGDGTARGNPDHVASIVKILIENALAHGAPPIKVIVDGPQVTVTDEGEGIPPQVIDNLWDLGSKGPDSEGTGIGLALCKELALAMDADIRLMPRDRGTCFNLTLKEE